MIKDKREYPKKGRKGMVLILTFIIIVTLTAIVTAFLYLTSTQLKSSGYDVASHKALWLAEAGIQQAIYYLTYTAGTGTVIGTLGGGSYSATVAGSGATRTITSTGTVGVISRTITQTVTVKSPTYQTGYGVDVTKDWNEQ